MPFPRLIGREHDFASHRRLQLQRNIPAKRRIDQPVIDKHLHARANVDGRHRWLLRTCRRGQRGANGGRCEQRNEREIVLRKRVGALIEL